MGIEIIAGRKTGVRRVGVGTPALLLHCSLAHSGAWSGVMARLEGLAMVAIDLPGHGGTAYDPDLEVQAQAVETAIAVLEGGEPAHVMGHSFGATIALRVAIARPDLVMSLSLYEPVYFSLLASGDPAAHAEETDASKPFTDCVIAKDWRGAAEAFLARWGTGAKLADMPELDQRFILSVMPYLAAEANPIIDTIAGDAVLASLPDVKTPCLLMEGARSPVVISQVNAVLATAMPNVQRLVLKNAGHMGPITHASEVADAINRFIQR